MQIRIVLNYIQLPYCAAKSTPAAAVVHKACNVCDLKQSANLAGLLSTHYNVFGNIRGGI